MTEHPDAYVHCRHCGTATTIMAATDIGAGEPTRCDMCDVGISPRLAAVVGRPAELFIVHEYPEPIGPAR
jgi:hypothetical protein